MQDVLASTACVQGMVYLTPHQVKITMSGQAKKGFFSKPEAWNYEWSSPILDASLKLKGLYLSLYDKTECLQEVKIVDSVDANKLMEDFRQLKLRVHAGVNVKDSGTCLHCGAPAKLFMPCRYCGK